MIFKKIILFFTIISLLSCKDYLNKIAPEKVIITPINFSSIDAYPLLPECLSVSDRVEQKTCFYQKLTARILNSLTSDLIHLSSHNEGDVIVKIVINSDGIASLDEIITSKTIKESIPKLEQVLQKSIRELPVFQPAIKSGIPVGSKFSLPIVFK